MKLQAINKILHYIKSITNPQKGSYDTHTHTHTHRVNKLVNRLKSSEVTFLNVFEYKES